MSFGQIAGAVVGGVIGFYAGGPYGAFVGASLGAGIGGIIDPLEPDIPSPGQPDIANLDMTSAQEGSVIMDFVGTTKLTGNIFYYAGSRATEVKEDQETGGKGGSSSKQVVVGIEYHLTWAIGLAVGPIDELYTVFSNDKVVWSGNFLRSEAVDGKSTISLDGMGSMTLYFGGTDQTPEDAIGDEVGDNANPSLRGLCWAFMDDCNLGDYNRAPTMRFVMRKSPEFDFSAVNVIETYDYNPAHAIYYILNTLCELDSSWMNDTAFAQFAMEVADNSETLGVSILFKHEDAIKYINSILTHVYGIMPYGDDTGQFEPRLMRNDVATSAMTLVTDLDCLEPPAITSVSYMDTHNDIKVQYSQIYEFETGNPAIAAVDQFDPDEDYNYVGIAATDKFNTYFVFGDTGGGNKPAANGTALAWAGSKTAEGAGEEIYDVTSKDWWFPAGQKKYEIEFTLDYSEMATTGQASYGFEPMRVGITSSAASIVENNTDEALVRMIGTSNGPLVTGRAGVGTTSIRTAYAASNWPLKFRIYNERNDSGISARTGIKYFDGVVGEWMDFDGNIDQFWFGIFETSLDRYLTQRFSTSSIFRNSTNSFRGGVQSYTVLQGAVTCVNAATYSDSFSGVAGGPIDSTKWVVETLTTGSAASLAPGGLDLRLTTGTGSAPNEATIQHVVEPEGNFGIEADVVNFGLPGGGATSFQGVRIVDTVTGYRWEAGIKVTTGSTLTMSRIWDGSTYTTLYSEAQTGSNYAFEIERYSSAGSIDIRMGSDVSYSGSVGNQVNTTNPVYIELFQLTGSAATDNHVSHVDSFTFKYLQYNGCTEEQAAPGAIDIRQATVHAEDPGNKETLNRIRHKDNRMMLFTNDANARWGAAQTVRTSSVPLRKIQMKMDRRGIFLPVGESFRYSSAKYNITNEVIFRVLSVREGDLTKEEFIIDALEDANYLSQIVVVDEGDRLGSKLNPYLLDVQNADQVEAPYTLVEENMYLVPLIGRKNGNETGYSMYMSTDGTSYSKQADISTFVTAGCLAATLPDSKAVLDNTNTLKVNFFYDRDAQDIETISRADMIAGKNLALLISGDTQEIISFETIIPTAVDGQYAITNLYRGRFDTESYEWASNSRFYFLGTAPPLVEMPGMFKGNTRHFKYVFYNTLKSSDLAEAESNEYSVLGRAWTPYEPGGFRCNDTSENSPGGAVYTSAISLDWNPEVRGIGAGRQDADTVIDAAPVWEGFFEVLASIGATVAFTDTEIDAITTGYTEGQIKAWNGGSLPSQIAFQLTNYIVTDGVRYQSPYNTLTVNKE